MPKIIAFILLCSVCDLFAQNVRFEQANALFGEQKIFLFRKFSIELKDDSEVELRKLTQRLQYLPGFLKDHYIIVQTFSCEPEIRVKPYIAVVRAKVIVDRLASELKVSHKRFLIMDGGITSFDKNCIGGSGANLFLRKEFDP